MTDRTLAWHFCATDPSGQHVGLMRDGRPVIVGEQVTHEGPIQICYSGLHSSLHVLDALKYAPGPVACLVETWGIEAREADKLVARHRRVLAAADCTAILRPAARRFALEVIHLWDAPTVVRQYLESGDESLREAACSAAWSAARKAPMNTAVGPAAGAANWAAKLVAAGATSDGPEDNTWGATYPAACEAVRAAAWEAAGVSDTAWTTAWDAAATAQNAMLEHLLLDAIPGARAIKEAP